MSGEANSRFFVGATESAKDTDLTQLATWLDCEVVKTRPWPKGRAGLVTDFEGLRLFSPSTKPQYWHPGMAHLRLKRSKDPLVDIIGGKGDIRVLDCTLGMGHDSLVLSAAGFHVTAIEQCAPLLFFTNQGMVRYREDLARRTTFIHGKFENHLRELPENSFHSVYLDPMFQKTEKRLDGYTWAVMRTLGLSESRYTLADLVEAYRVTSHHLILKLSPFEPPPTVEGLPVAQLCGSRRVKYARWTKATN